MLATLSDEGHVYVPRPRLLSASVEILTIDPPLIEKAIGDLAAEERVVIEPLPSGDEPSTSRPCTRRRRRAQAANALVNVAWRNGSVENIHAGAVRGYPVDRRRLTAAEERTLFGFAVDRLTTGMGCATALPSSDPRGRGPSKSCPTAWPGRCGLRPWAGRSPKMTREARLPRG